MERFFVHPEDVQKDCLYIRNSEAHHIKDVLRYKIADKISAFDGKGRIFEGEIEGIKSKEIKVKILSVENKEKQPPFFHLVQAIPKKQKMDFIVEKATELGVDEVIPIITQRTVSRPSKEKEKKLLERWNRIILVAVKQSGRIFLPQISPIKIFSQVIEELPKDSIFLIPYVGEKILNLKNLDWQKFKEKVFIFIGPEGDFSEEEVACAKRKGAIPISLGEYVLRTETAALYLLSILNYKLRMNEKG